MPRCETDRPGSCKIVHQLNKNKLLHLPCSFQNDKDKENFKKLIEIIDEAKGDKKIGVFQKDSFLGEFCTAWKAVLDNRKYHYVDISSAFGYVIAPKEESEVALMKKACLITVDVFGKYLKENIMEIIDADKVKRCVELFKYSILENTPFGCRK